MLDVPVDLKLDIILENTDDWSINKLMHNPNTKNELMKSTNFRSKYSGLLETLKQSMPNRTSRGQVTILRYLNESMTHL